MEGRPAGRSLCVQVRAPGEGAVLGEMRVRLIPGALDSNGFRSAHMMHFMESETVSLHSVSSHEVEGPCHGVRAGTRGRWCLGARVC